MEKLPRERPGIAVQAIGATGYIGAPVARELLRAGYTLIGPVRARSPAPWRARERVDLRGGATRRRKRPSPRA